MPTRPRQRKKQYPPGYHACGPGRAVNARYTSSCPTWKRTREFRLLLTPRPALDRTTVRAGPEHDRSTYANRNPVHGAPSPPLLAPCPSFVAVCVGYPGDCGVLAGVLRAPQRRLGGVAGCAGARRVANAAMTSRVQLRFWFLVAMVAAAPTAVPFGRVI